MPIVGPLPNNIQDGQIIDAVPVMGNFNWIVNQVNSNAGPAGSNKQIQFNSSGVFGASADLTWDGSTTTLGILGQIDCLNGIRSTGPGVFTTGVGVDMYWNAGITTGVIQAYDHGASAFKTMAIEGSTVLLNIGTVNKALVDANGSLLIGYATTNGASYLCQVNSQIFATNATIATSDERVKTNFKPLENTSDAFDAIETYEFDFIDHEKHNFSKNRQIGFKAQQLKSALSSTGFADCVVHQTEDEEGLMGTADTKLLPIIVKELQDAKKAIKMQQELITALMTKVGATS